MQEKIGKALIVLGVIILGVTAYLLTQFGGFNLSDFGILSALCLLNGVSDILTGICFYKSNMTNEGII